MNSPFPCSQCGRCCQLVDRSALTRHLDRGDGTCLHFDAVRLQCGIYEQRPDLCRVDRQYTLHYAKQISWDDFVTLNLRVCAALQHPEFPLVDTPR